MNHSKKKESLTAFVSFSRKKELVDNLEQLRFVLPDFNIKRTWLVKEFSAHQREISSSLEFVTQYFPERVVGYDIEIERDRLWYVKTNLYNINRLLVELKTESCEL